MNKSEYKVIGGAHDGEVVDLNYTEFVFWEIKDGRLWLDMYDINTTTRELTFRESQNHEIKES